MFITRWQSIKTCLNLTRHHISSTASKALTSNSTEFYSTMCHFKIVKYTGCGCEMKVCMARCSQGDGVGNCGGQCRYERAVLGGVCGRENCSYYEFPQPRTRWGSGEARSRTSSGTSSIMDDDDDEGRSWMSYNMYCRSDADSLFTPSSFSSSSRQMACGQPLLLLRRLSISCDSERISTGGCGGGVVSRMHASTRSAMSGRSKTR